MKNLLDVSEEIEKMMSYINRNNERIIGIEINQNTLDYLKMKGVYKFKNIVNEDIPIIINNSLINNEIKFHREKNIKETEYEPYEENKLGVILSE